MPSILASPSIFIDTTSSLSALLATLTNTPLASSTEKLPSLYIDLEGNNLGRHGTISLLTLYILPTNTTYLIDITTLSSLAFTTPPPTSPSTTLRSILESPEIGKAFFDVRTDSNALYFHHRIALAGITDIQLLELASRPGLLSRKRLLSGLARCIKYDASLSASEKLEWESVKQAGRARFAPEMGGTYGAFDARPLGEEMRAYCVQDVRFLPGLCALYRERLVGDGSYVWTRKVDLQTRERLELSRTEGYDPSARSNALGPWVEEGKEEEAKSAAK